MLICREWVVEISVVEPWQMNADLENENRDAICKCGVWRALFRLFASLLDLERVFVLHTHNSYMCDVALADHWPDLASPVGNRLLMTNATRSATYTT